MSLAHLMRSNKKGKPVTMCEVLDRIENRGIEKGKIKGQLELLTSLIKDGVLTLKQAAEKMGMTVTKFKAAMKEVATNW